MAIRLDSVDNQPLQVTVAIPADGSASTAFDFSGILLDAGQVYLLQSGDGTAQTLDLSSWEFDSAATVENPITIQVQGASITLIVPASVPARVSSGTVIIEAISPFWRPSDLDSGLDPIANFHAVDSEVDTSSGMSVSETGTGGRTLSRSGTFVPSHDPSNGVFAFRDDMLNLSSPFTCKLVYIVLKRVAVNGDQNYWANDSSNNSRIQERSSSVLRLSNESSADVLFNGAVDGSGDPDFTSVSGDTAIYPASTGVGTSDSGDWFILIAKWTSTLNIEAFGGGQGSSTNRLDADVRAMGLSAGVHTDAEILKLQGYLCWDLVNSGLVASIDDLMPNTHPYYSGPPALTAGGGTSSVTVVTPTVTLTLSGLVAGSRIYIYNTTDSAVLYNEIEATTSFTGVVPPGKALLIRIRNASGSPKYKPYATTATVPSSSFEIVVNQELDE